jgi:replicative DNA helicase
MKEDNKNELKKVLKKSTSANQQSPLYDYQTDEVLSKRESIESESLKELVIKSLNHSSPIKTGFHEFDRRFDGFSSGELVLIGSRPAMGKTQFLINLALNLSRAATVLFYSLDLSKLKLTIRFLASLSQIKVDTIVKGDLTEEQRNSLESVSTTIESQRLLINDGPFSSLSELLVNCSNQIKKHEAKVLIIDFPNTTGFQENKKKVKSSVNSIIQELNHMARSLNICIVLTTPLGRSVEKRVGLKRPILSDLFEIGINEQYLDKVIFMYRPDYYGIEADEEAKSTALQIELIFAKNRNGYTGSITLQRDKYFTNIFENENEISYFSTTAIR